MKKILILSSNMGQGHMSAAKAVQQGFQQLYPDEYEIEIVDLMELLSRSVNRVSQKTYDSLSRRAPSICEFIFESWDKPWKMKLLNHLNYGLVLRKVKKFIEAKKPDLVISTFPVWDYLMRKMLKKYSPEVKFISIVTDSIFIHNAWIIGDADEQIVANEDTAQAIKELGYDSRKIKKLGFPVNLNFLTPINKKTFLKKEKLDPGKFTILFLPTAQKLQRNIKIMEELLKHFADCNIVVIAGRDTKIKSKMEVYKLYENVKIVGWTNQMAHYMKTADIVLTKAGGATVMECIAAKKPMIITSTIARHERGNAELVRRYHLGIVEDVTKSEINKSISTIRKNYQNYQKNLQKLSNPRAALTIARHIAKLLKNPEK